MRSSGDGSTQHVGRSDTQKFADTNPPSDSNETDHEPPFLPRAMSQDASVGASLRSLGVRPTPPRSLSTAGVLAGDALVVATFIGYGLYSHGIVPWEYPVYAVDVLTPFLLAWLLVAGVAGLYHSRTLTSLRRSALLTAGGWTVAALLASALRATAFFPGDAPLTFVLVNLGIGMAFVLPWRLAVAGLFRRQR